jgi:thiol-disulfide isomerase/thioredoxin
VARVRAPELLGRGGWIGANPEFGLSALSGKVVVLHFWRYSCINCIRVLSELRPVEERFAEEAVVIGIHSPKFPREHDHAAVERAVERLGLRHPVLDDPDLATWHQYGVKGWPTLVVVDPEGYVVGGVSGEGSGPVVFSAVERAAAEHDAKATLIRGPVTGVWGSMTLSTGIRAVNFPAKVVVDADGRRLALTDAVSGRVVVTDLHGRVEQVYALLTRPQGVRFDGDRILVCDTGTDRVLAVDRASGEQTVVADGLASPSDVAVLDDGSLLIAESGRHRLWRVPAGGGDKEAVAGTGQENLVDTDEGTPLLAQPAGVAALPGGGAVFVDADSSALRVLTPDGRIVTLVGQGLFDWGASDGGPESSAMQYPLGVAVGPAADGALPSVFVADTFNGLLREWRGSAWDPGAGTLRTLPAAGLEEPSGLDVLPDGRLVVTDTNHHRVVMAAVGEIVPEPVAIDESWLGTAVGEAIAAGAGTTFAVPYGVDGEPAVGGPGGPPVQVDVSADPPTLLAAGPRRWALHVGTGTVEVTAGEPGEGVLVVAVQATLTGDDDLPVRRSRARHDLLVTASGSPPPSRQGGEPAPATDPGTDPGTTTAAYRS